jgi:hypothetical protein
MGQENDKTSFGVSAKTPNVSIAISIAGDAEAAEGGGSHNSPGRAERASRLGAVRLCLCRCRGRNFMEGLPAELSAKPEIRKAYLGL